MNNQSSDTSVNLVSTLDKADMDTVVSGSVVKHNDHKPDPRFESHCVDAKVIRSDQSAVTVCLLRDTGALQSLISSQILTDGDYRSTDEVRLIRGITGDIISVPLIEITLKSALCTGTYLCGIVSTLPSGIAVLVGNDLCPDTYSRSGYGYSCSSSFALLKAIETQLHEVQKLAETVSEVHF